MNLEEAKKAFVESIDVLSKDAHNTMVEKGFWETPRNEGEAIALMHSELSEGLEALRHGNPPDDKIPEFDSLSAEFSDVILRMFDYQVGFNKQNGTNYDFANALISKMNMNKTREKRHGKNF